MNSSKLLVVLTAFIFLIYGMLFVLFPVQLLELVANGVVTSASAVIDMRATYGGMSVAVGFILLLLAKSEETIKVGLMSVFLLMVSMAIGRMVGILIDQNPNVMMYVYLALEIINSVLSAFLLKALPKVGFK
ncbi:MAG: DUF4345 family protein [Bermanella sp.]